MVKGKIRGEGLQLYLWIKFIILFSLNLLVVLSVSFSLNRHQVGGFVLLTGVTAIISCYDPVLFTEYIDNEEHSDKDNGIADAVFQIGYLAIPFLFFTSSGSGFYAFFLAFFLGIIFLFWQPLLINKALLMRTYLEKGNPKAYRLPAVSLVLLFLIYLIPGVWLFQLVTFWGFFIPLTVFLWMKQVKKDVNTYLMLIVWMVKFALVYFLVLNPVSSQFFTPSPLNLLFGLRISADFLQLLIRVFLLGELIYFYGRMTSGLPFGIGKK